jgi:hypothetical protein
LKFKEKPALMPVMKLAFLFVLFIGGSVWARPTSEDFERWANSQEWQNLLHMQAGPYHPESKIRGGEFFLHPKGHRDPRAEMEMDFERMFEASAEIQIQTQCRFLARRDYFLRQKAVTANQILACAFSDEWLQKLNAQKISLIFASGYMNSAASSFGHTFLRLENPTHQGGRELLDYGINFSARTEDTQGALYALYGLFGFFPGKFAMLPYHQMIKDYTHLEGRDLWEYELNFTPEEVRRVLYHLLELENSYVDYYFLDDNCSFMILKILEVGRPGLNLADDEEFFVIPLDTVKRALPIIAKVQYRPSLETEWQQRLGLLSKAQREQIQNLQPDSAAIDLQQLVPVSLEAASYFVALKELENHERWKNLNYQLKLEQAKQTNAVTEFKVATPSPAPHEGHHSSGVELGFSQIDSEQAMTFGTRAAFHDQLSRQVGVPPFSHLEVLGLRWRILTTSQIIPIRYRILETLSTRPVSLFETPVSWGVSLGGDSWNGSSLRSHATGRVGLSLDLIPEKVRWTQLAKGGTHQEIERGFQFVAGSDSRLWILWTPRIRSFFQFEWTRFPSFESRQTVFQQAIDLDLQLELRVGWSTWELAGERRIEKFLFLLQNF